MDLQIESDSASVSSISPVVLMKPKKNHQSIDTQQDLRLFQKIPLMVPAQLRGKIPFTPNGHLNTHPAYQVLPSCRLMLEEYRKERLVRAVSGEYQVGEIIPLAKDQEKLRKIFKVSSGISKRKTIDVYNITVPFLSGDETYIAARAEARIVKYSSKVIFLKQVNSDWVLQDKPVFDLMEDPFIAVINNQLVFGGVKIDVAKSGQLIKNQTLFYRGKKIEDLKFFAAGPLMMKDIRLVQLPKKKIGLFTRPQGEIGGRGQIGYTIIDSLDQLTPEVVIGAPLIDHLFPPYEWGGPNEAHLLKDGRILVVGHRSYWDHQGKHYYSWMFTYHPATGDFQDLGIIAERSDFPDGPMRGPNLKDVLFTGGLKRLGNGLAELYVGLSDTQAGKIVIPDPVTDP